MSNETGTVSEPPPRQRLRDTALSGSLSVVRRVWAWTMVVACGVAAAGYAMPAHRLKDESTFHSNYDDGGAFPFVVFVFVAASLVRLRKRKLGSGIASALACSGGAILSVLPIFLTHFLSSYDAGPGETWFAAGFFALFFGGLVMVIAEPILYVLQRAAIERATKITLPEARVRT